MSTHLAYSFLIAAVVTYFLKKLCSVQCTVVIKQQKEMVKNFSIWSSASNPPAECHYNILSYSPKDRSIMARRLCNRDN